jgi:hypothetical protein
LRHQRRQPGQRQRCDDPHQPVAAADQPGHPLPHPAPLLNPGPVRRPERPEPGPSQQGQRRRQVGQHHQHRGGHPGRGHRTQALVRAQVAEQQAEQGQDNRRAGGEDRPERAPPRHPYRCEAVLVPPQLLPVARDQQQRVVGGRAEHQDQHDPLALPIQDHQVDLNQRIHHRRGRPQRQPGTGQHHQRQQRAAVDHQQDQRHHRSGDHQQHTIDIPERLTQIGGEPGRAGDVHVHLLRRATAGQLPQRGHGVTGIAAGHRHHHLGSGAIRRHHRRRRLTCHTSHTGELGRDLRHRRQVGLTEATVASEHDHGRDGLAVGEPFLKLGDPGRLRGLGQEGGAIVLLDAGQPALEAAEWTAHNQPHHHQHDRPQQRAPPPPPLAHPTALPSTGDMPRSTRRCGA